ncbi:uncharacterized protein LOC144448561 [Glandiceps talaboti]
MRSRQYKMMKRREAKLIEEERTVWKDVRAKLMSDEEVEEDGTVNVWRPKWRTRELNAIIDRLNARLKECPKTSKLMKRRTYVGTSTRERPSRPYPIALVSHA